MTFSGAMNVATEHRDHPTGMLQSVSQPQHFLRRFEVKPVWPNRDFKWRMMRENGNGLFGPGVDQVDQMSGLFG